MTAPTRSLNVTVNGSLMEIPEGTTVAELLRLLEIEPQMVAVELNLQIVLRAEYLARKIESGDTLEIVQFVGGG